MAATALALVPTAALAKPVLPGVPRDASLLFALDANSGHLVHHRGAPRDRFSLTLSGVGRRTTWFADRPLRDAGRVGSRALFGAWARLGFRSSPPNAALTVDRARSARDTLAVELRLRRYNPRRRTVRFAVRRLGSLGNGLHHLNRRLDPRLRGRFGSASLFIDNAAANSSTGCTLGQPQLMTIGEIALANHVRLSGLTPAKGQMLSASEPSNRALFSLYGATFGGDGFTSFAVPALSSPPGTQWYVCTEGRYPEREDLGPGVLGEIDYWTSPGDVSTDPRWAPADGRTVSAGAYPEYASAFANGQSSFQLPDVPAPAGMTSLVRVRGGGGEEGGQALGQLDVVPAQPATEAAGARWLPAQGQQLAGGSYPGLSTLVNGGNLGSEPFDLPSVPAPAAGVGYYVAVTGAWPLE